MVHALECDPFLRQRRLAVCVGRLQARNSELSAALRRQDVGPRQDAPQDMSRSGVGAEEVGLEGARKGVFGVEPFADLGGFVVADKVDVEVVFGGHDFWDDVALEVAVVFLGDDDARVGLGDVAEEVDPVAGGYQAELFGVGTQELGVVDDFLGGGRQSSK